MLAPKALYWTHIITPECYTSLLAWMTCVAPRPTPNLPSRSRADRNSAGFQRPGLVSADDSRWRRRFHVLQVPCPSPFAPSVEVRNVRIKVLLVYPEFPDTYWSFQHALGLWNKRSAFPPLGLMTVAAMLPATWEQRLVDLNVRRLTHADIAWADLVFASAMIVQQDSLRQIIRRCRAQGKRVVVGGPFVSTSVKAIDADHVFVGEAETTLPQFIRDLEAGCPRSIYQADEKPALTSTPVPRFQLADFRHYMAMPVQYSRGCPFRCEFCDIIEIYGRVPRTKTNEQMLAELDALYHG